VSAPANIDANDDFILYGAESVRAAFARRADTVPPLARERAEIVTLLGHLPERELTARARLLAARNLASLAAHRAKGPHSRSHLWQIAELATALVFGPGDPDRLERFCEYCDALFAAARIAKALEAPDGLV